MNQNSRYGIRIWAALLLLVLTAGIFSGCTLPTTSSTSVSIDENGVLTEEIVENQGNGEYMAEELQAYIEEDLEVYNRGKEEPAITLQSCKVENGKVRLSLRYAGCDDYAAYNQVTCFRGTLQEAQASGYSIDMTWYEPNGQAGDSQIIMERAKEWKVVIVSEPISVKVPDKILYASDNVDITGRLTAKVLTVMNKEEEETALTAGGSSSGEDTQKKKKNTQLHPLSTVSQRFAYIIYK